MATRETQPDAQERRAILLLGLPTFGLALSITVVTTYLPLIAQEFTDSATIVGLVLAAEGMLALSLPLVVGPWSDQLRTEIGGRLPFLIVATPPLVIALALLGFAGTMAIAVVLVVIFFVGYFVAYEPYRALYPDLVSSAHAGWSQSVQAVWRGAATGLALVAGGLLFDLAQWLPFVAAAALTVAAMGVFLRAMLGRPPRPRGATTDTRSVREAVRDVRGLVGAHPALRAFLIANALWEASLAALKTFVLLYITQGLGMSLADGALIVGGAACIVLVGAVACGRLADRHGRLRVMRITLTLYGAGLLLPAFTTELLPLVLLIPLAAFGGGTIMTLPYALLMPMMPAGSHGALTGFYSLSRGVGTMAGPLLAGFAIDMLGGVGGAFESTEGYSAMWLVCGGTILLSLIFLARLRAAREDRIALAHGG